MIYATMWTASLAAHCHQLKSSKPKQTLSMDVLFRNLISQVCKQASGFF